MGGAGDDEGRQRAREGPCTAAVHHQRQPELAVLENPIERARNHAYMPSHAYYLRRARARERARGGGGAAPMKALMME